MPIAWRMLFTFVAGLSVFHAIGIDSPSVVFIGARLLILACFLVGLGYTRVFTTVRSGFSPFSPGGRSNSRKIAGNSYRASGFTALSDIDGPAFAGMADGSIQFRISDRVADPVAGNTSLCALGRRTHASRQ